MNNLKIELKREPSIDYMNGQPWRVRVVLENEDGVYYPVFFPLGHESKSLPELQGLALDVIYAKNFPGRFEEEQFNLVGTKISQIDDALEKSNTATEAANKAAEMSQGGLLSLLELLLTKGLIEDEDLAQLTSQN